MSSKEIKDHYGDFVETARREPVIHTSHGRPTLLTLSIEDARRIPELRAKIQHIGESRTRRSLLDYLGKGRRWSRFKSDEDIKAFIRKERDAWR